LVRSGAACRRRGAVGGVSPVPEIPRLMTALTQVMFTRR